MGTTQSAIICMLIFVWSLHQCDSTQRKSTTINAEIGQWLHTLEITKIDSSAPPPSMMLVTGQGPTGAAVAHHDENDDRYHCRTPEGLHILTKAYKNKVDYCNFHDCVVRNILDDWPAMTATMATASASPNSRTELGGAVFSQEIWWIRRLDALLRLMRAYPSAEWFLWMDGETLFTNLSFSLPLGSYKAWGKHLVIPSNQSKPHEDKDHSPTSISMFLVRNSAWAADFLSNWVQRGRSIMQQKQAEGNSVTTAEMERSALLQAMRQANAEGKQAKIFMEDSYNCMFGHGNSIIERFQDVMVEGVKATRWHWPFVVYFDGCGFCDRDTISKACISAFQQTFHFADNQLLALVGLQHQHLYNTLAQPFRIDA